jgi:putative flippase GtrA
MMGSTLLFKFLKFCVVGASGTFIDFGTTWLLREKVKLNQYFANSIGFVLAASSNYLFNRIWTFESQNSHIATEYLSFFTIAAIGLGINNLIIRLLFGRFRLNFYFSKVFATGVVMIWNFGMNYFVTFGR